MFGRDGKISNLGIALLIEQRGKALVWDFPVKSSLLVIN